MTGNSGSGGVLVFKKVAQDIEILGSIHSLTLSKDERKYIAHKAGEDSIFTFYHSSGVYRCGVRGEIIACVPITDTLQELDNVHKEYNALKTKVEDMESISMLVIHDVKNYILVLDGRISLMKEGSGVVDAETLEDMQKVVSKIKELFKKVSLLTMDKNAITKEKINIASMLTNIFSNFKLKLDEKKIEYAIYCDVERIFTDTLIEEVLVNIINNAIAHTPEGGTITVECRNREGRYRIKIADTGAGVPDDLKELIFEQIKNSSSRFGMGLGLAVARHITHLLGGKIWVEDNEPKGSVFVVELPEK